jgi:FixJ family two-component response regulator
VAKHAEDVSLFAEVAGIKKRLSALTPRELEVMGLVVKGKMNKEIASDLGVSIKTVKIHRGRVMKKMEAASLAQLIRMAAAVGIS